MASPLLDHILSDRCIGELGYIVIDQLHEYAEITIKKEPLVMCIVDEHQLSKWSGVSKVKTNLLVSVTVPTAAL